MATATPPGKRCHGKAVSGKAVSETSGTEGKWGLRAIDEGACVGGFFLNQLIGNATFPRAYGKPRSRTGFAKRNGEASQAEGVLAASSLVSSGTGSIFRPPHFAQATCHTGPRRPSKGSGSCLVAAISLRKWGQPHMRKWGQPHIISGSPQFTLEQLPTSATSERANSGTSGHGENGVGENGVKGKRCQRPLAPRVGGA